MSSSSPLLAALAVMSILCPARADLEADPKAGARLLAEGDKLADQGDPNEAVARYKKAFEQLLPGMRKIPFKHEVKRDVTAREDMGAMLKKELDAEITPAEFRANELGMKALGLLPYDFNLKETMIKVYSEEIAAFYDTKTKTMHLIKEPEEKVKKAPTFLEKLMGKTGGFDKDENKTVIAHELTHALADQNFDLDAMQEAVKQDDDRDLALSSLIEGEATLTMIGASMEDWTGSVIRDVPASRLDKVFSLMIPFMPLAGGSSLREAPVILSESMIFPYLRGLVFCARLTNDGGWAAINDAYKNPPLSTEQIIHPEKYRAKPDVPMDVDLGKIEIGDGWAEVGRNVVGEMQLGVMLRRHGGKAAVTGWDGDRFAVFEAPGQRLGLVWLTTWDSESDAEKFAKHYGDYQASKADAKAPAAEPAKNQDQPKLQGKSFSIRRRGQDVAIVEGFSPEQTEMLLELSLRARKTEKVNTPTPKPEPVKAS
ncbi:hypothetical protein [Singulisphaera sp. PoT]|uniref:hypothetical protein n=1 Tax=Singulisphaera sp. PoT TaxID=3411797 RepID=UPI003BF60187